MKRRAPINMPDQMYSRLIRESRRTGAPISELIRRAVDAVYPGPEDLNPEYSDAPNLRTNTQPAPSDKPEPEESEK